VLVSREGAGWSCIDIVDKAFILAVCYCWLRRVVVHQSVRLCRMALTM